MYTHKDPGNVSPAQWRRRICRRRPWSGRRDWGRGQGSTHDPLTPSHASESALQTSRFETPEASAGCQWICHSKLGCQSEGKEWMSECENVYTVRDGYMFFWIKDAIHLFGVLGKTKWCFLQNRHVLVFLSKASAVDKIKANSLLKGVRK